MLEAGLGRVVNNDAHQAVSAVSAYAISAKPIGVLGAVGSAASCTSSCTSPLQKNRLSFAAHVLGVPRAPCRRDLVRFSRFVVSILISEASRTSFFSITFQARRAQIYFSRESR